MGKRKEYTRNGRTMTEAQFWSVIRSALRKKLREWPKTTTSPPGWQPAKQAIERHQKKINGSLHVQCQSCFQWFRKSPPKGTRRAWQLHHVIECGNLPDDATGFVNRLFCEDSDLLIPLCKECHKKEKTR